MQVNLLVEGGEMKPGPVLSQKLGPVGIPINQVIQKVNEATTNFKGMKVPVILEIDPSTKDFSVIVSSPPVSELIKKELEAGKGSSAQKKIKIANASIEQIISISKTKLQNLLCKDLKAAVKIVLGSCLSLGVIVENKDPREIISLVDSGFYDEEISNEKTGTSEEKRKKLDEYFSEISLEQDKIIKAEEALKASQEAKAEKAAAKQSGKKEVPKKDKK